jgi:uncharacterized protein YceH (UPF0502 family)
MRFLAGIRDSDKREAAEQSLIKGKSPDTVKMQVRGKDEPEDPRGQLEKEKARLERTIATLTKRLEEVKSELKKKN